MSKRTAKDAIKKIAKREGRSESEIREEIEKVIMIGFLNKEKNLFYIILKKTMITLSEN
ncbi:MAG: hypothetical protein NC124_11500 [Clostridium sp.]|nr:hypothetical protein [Clostridium sp.]